MPRRKPRSVLGALLLLVAVALSGCGGGTSEGDVEALLDRAFRQPVKSADIKVDAELSIQGLEGFDRPLRLRASGPFVSGDGKLPQLDIDVDIGSPEAGQTVQTGVLITGDRAFLKFGGQFYEQPQADVARANAELAKGSKRRGGSLRDLGLSPRAWVVDAKGEEDEKIAGVDTEHVSAKLDARRLFADLNRFVERSANAVGGAAPEVPDPLTPQQLDQLSEVVKSPTFDVYVSKEDSTIRRISANLRVAVPEAQRPRANGIEGGSLRFTIELRKVNGDQAVEAPAKARPIADLRQQLGGARALGGGQPDAYTRCLDATRPDDTEARARCRELLR